MVWEWARGCVGLDCRLGLHHDRGELFYCITAPIFSNLLLIYSPNLSLACSNTLCTCCYSFPLNSSSLSVCFVFSPLFAESNYNHLFYWLTPLAAFYISATLPAQGTRRIHSTLTRFHHHLDLSLSILQVCQQSMKEYFVFHLYITVQVMTTLKCGQHEIR